MKVMKFQPGFPTLSDRVKMYLQQRLNPDTNPVNYSLYDDF